MNIYRSLKILDKLMDISTVIYVYLLLLGNYPTIKTLQNWNPISIMSLVYMPCNKYISEERLFEHLTTFNLQYVINQLASIW